MLGRIPTREAASATEPPTATNAARTSTIWHLIEHELQRGTEFAVILRDQGCRFMAAYERWNPMLCAKAMEHGFVCLDVYHAFNGPAGDKPSGAHTIDGAHPSQAGNDLIAAMLAKLDTSVLGK